MIRNKIRSQILLSVLIVLAGLPSLSNARAQERKLSSDSQNQELNYSSESSSRNEVVFDLNGATAYDDNVFGDNQHRVGDEVYELGGRIGFHENRARSDFNLDYSPEAVIYRHVQGFNRANQALRFDGDWLAGRHFEFRLKGNSSYTTGVFFAAQNANFNAQNGPPPGLNSTTYTPLARSLANQARADAIYQFNPRWKFDFFAQIENQNYSGESGPSLFNSVGEGTGAEISYRTSRTLAFGTQYLYQRVRFGSFELDQVHSVYFSIKLRPAARVNVNLFGGPQYALLDEYAVPNIVLSGSPSPTTPAGTSSQWEPAAGGSVTWRSPATAIEIGAQRVYTDGGGLLTGVMGTSEDANLRRRLVRKWDLLLRTGVARSSALGQVFANGSVDDQTAGAALEYHFMPTMTAQLGYNYIRQRISGTVPFLANMDRSYASFSLFFEPARIPLGR